jgi:hypothetical protein
MYWLDVTIAPHSRFSVEGGLPLATGDALKCDYVWFHLSPYKINASFWTLLFYDHHLNN